MKRTDMNSKIADNLLNYIRDYIIDWLTHGFLVNTVIAFVAAVT